MRRFVVIEKSVGETPLQAMDAYRAADAALARVPLTCAGRLDPMASGKLLVLIGDECKERERYDGLDKEYIFEVLFGFESDTGDVLGIASAGRSFDISDESLAAVARMINGTHTLPYPAYSSKTVAGKPLFQYALDGTLGTITIPTTDMRVYSMRYLDKMVLYKPDLVERVLAKLDRLVTAASADVSLLGAGFRKDEICKRWWSLDDRRKTPYVIARFAATVSSGTYIRSLAPLMAKELGTVGLAYSIRRTKIGRYLPLSRRFGFWLSSY